jgi:predicted HicB family RNase H-like nuclease
MGTEFKGMPEHLMLKVKEAAQRDEISVDELVQEALVQRVNVKGHSSFLDR